MTKLVNMIHKNIMMYKGRNNENIKKYIIDHPEEINDDTSRCNWTPLGAACYQGNIEIADFLLANGANVEKGSFFKSPLLITCYSPNLTSQTKITLINSLIQNGADINKGAYCSFNDASNIFPIQFPKNMTALDIAALYREWIVFKHLLKLGAKPDQSLCPKMVKEFLTLGPKTTLFFLGMTKDNNHGSFNSEIAKFGQRTDLNFKKHFIRMIKDQIEDSHDKERNKIYERLKTIKHGH